MLSVLLSRKYQTLAWILQRAGPEAPRAGLRGSKCSKLVLGYVTEVTGTESKTDIPSRS